MSCDGGGARATLEVLLHFHGFKNLDLRSRGVFCVETVVFPVSHPSAPGVPFKTFHDPAAKRSTARGILVNPVEGDVERRGLSGISAAGLPSYTSSHLPIRFTNEHVQLNEGCLFRVHIDADWLETDIIAIEFRLMTMPVPESDQTASAEDPSPKRASANPVSSPDRHGEVLNEVGKVTFHTKCASSKGGLHRYHPLVFKQPYLCVLDLTLHMALTSINHPGGPAGLAAAIAANAFPSEEINVPAPRGAESPVRRATPSHVPTPPHSEGRRRAKSGSGVADQFGDGTGASLSRPRFITPGRSRKSAFAAKRRASSFGGGSSLFSGSPERSKANKVKPARSHRLPLSAEVLERASQAIGLATALGFDPPAVDPHRGVTASAVYRAAELLYSRHALGLRWSKGALAVAKSTAAANAAEMAAASAAAAAAVAAAKRTSKSKTHVRGKSSGGRMRSDNSDVADEAAKKAKAENGLLWGGADGGGSTKRSPRFISQNGALEGLECSSSAAVNKKAAVAPTLIPVVQGDEGELEKNLSRTPSMTSTKSKGKGFEVKPSSSPRQLPSTSSATATATTATATAQAITRRTHGSPGPPPRGQQGRRKKEGGSGGAGEGGPAPQGHSSGAVERGQTGGRGVVDGDSDEIVAEADGGGGGTWTWGVSGGMSNGKNVVKTPLPSDLRQLSRVIHVQLQEASVECNKMWLAFAKSTFECGRRNLIALREEWVRDTTRAWSGQCLEVVSQDRADLVRLNRTLLDPNGFVALRARAGIRLKRGALPTKGGGGGGGGPNSRRRRSTVGRSAGGVGATNVDRRLPEGMARLRALSSSGTWTNDKVYGRSNSTSSLSVAVGGGSNGGAAAGAPAAATGGGGGGGGADQEDDDLDDDMPPELDALVPSRRDPQHQAGGGAGAGPGVGAGISSAASTPVSTSSWMTAGTPKEQSASATWGGGLSPWGNGNGRTPQRPEKGWFKRISAGSVGSIGSFNQDSPGSLSFSADSTADCSPQRGSGGIMDFPPPPQSLLPVFDRDLHGFDPSAREDERWGELPFLVVESWGGLGEEALCQEPAPVSPMLGGDEYRLFQEIASNSSHHKKPPLLPNGKGGSSTHPDAKTPSAAPPSVPSTPTVRAIPPISLPLGSPPQVPAPVRVPPDDILDGDTPPPPSYLASTPRAEGGAKGGSNRNDRSGGESGGARIRPILAHSTSAPFPASSDSSYGSSVWSPAGDRHEDSDELWGGGSASGTKRRSIWDHPRNPARQHSKPRQQQQQQQQQRGPNQHQTARNSRPPSCPFGSSAVVRGSCKGSPIRSLSLDETTSFDDNIRSSGETNPSRSRGLGTTTATTATSNGEKRTTKRDEIKKRMWGKRPSWTSALIEPTASAASAGAAAASVPGATTREASGATAAPRTESGLNHLIVLVHGLGGRPADMAYMRSYLQTLMPGAELMVATSLQDVRKDNLGVEAMGKRLAEEVHNHVIRFCPYLGSAFVPVPTHTTPTAAAAAARSLPLSPVTPLRPVRRDRAVPSPARTRAAPGSAATARSAGDELGGGAGAGTSTPSRSGRGGGASSGGVPQNKGTLSFVCFSLGGLVARSALLEPAMVPYLTSLQCFVTLGCPHLGQTSTPLSFFKTGAWAVRKLTGLQVLHELDLDDAEDPRETVLYRLSLSPGLERFRTIVFAANPRDGFVPLHSASVRQPPDSMYDGSGHGGGGVVGGGGGGGDSSKSGRTSTAAAEMAEMLMSKVDERINRVVRITLDAPRNRQPQGALDSVIGRAGHMCFIDSAPVAWLLALALLPFLEESVERVALP